MSLITIISLLLIILGTTDFFTSKMPKLQEDIFKVSFILTYILFTIKYYYGADIYNYVPFYENIPSIKYILNNYKYIQFEIGFALFCSILNQMHFSFWAMTAIVSTIYFTAIYKLFKHIEKKKTFALMILVILDNNLIFAAYRQCMSVAFYIFFIIALQNKKYLESIIYRIVTISFHKSGIFVIFPTIFLYIITNSYLKKYIYEILLLALCLFIFIPIVNIISPITDILPIPDDFQRSIHHHLILGKEMQVIFLVYLTLIICINYFYKEKIQQKRAIQSAAFFGIILIIFLYQYYYILNRIRSYFIPFIITFIFNITNDYFNGKEQNKIPYATLIKQASILFIFIYSIYFTFATEIRYSKTVSQFYDCTTIFELTRYNKGYIKNRQMQKAKIYWTKDFMRNDKNNRINQK